MKRVSGLSVPSDRARMASDNGSTGQDGVGRLDRGPPRIIRGLSSLLVFGGEARPVYTALVALGVATALLESISLGVISLLIINLVADQGVLPEGGLMGQALQLIHSITGKDNGVIFAILIALVMLRAVVIYAYSYLSESMRIRTYQRFREVIFENYLTAACAAASLAIGTRNGEHET